MRDHARSAEPGGTEFDVRVQKPPGFTVAHRFRSAAVHDLLRSFEGARDVNLSITDRTSGAELLVAIDGLHWMLGAYRTGRPFQFIRYEGRSAKVQMLIGGQPTDLDERYLLDLDSALRVAGDWLEGTTPRDAPDLGFWEAQG